MMTLVEKKKTERAIEQLELRAAEWDGVAECFTNPEARLHYRNFGARNRQMARILRAGLVDETPTPKHEAM
jgi:hypothetical protein